MPRASGILHSVWPHRATVRHAPAQSHPLTRSHSSPAPKTTSRETGALGVGSWSLGIDRILYVVSISRPSNRAELRSHKPAARSRCDGLGRRRAESVMLSPAGAAPRSGKAVASHTLAALGAAARDAVGRHLPGAPMRLGLSGERGSHGPNSQRGIDAPAFRLRSASERSALRPPAKA